ncbi:hypothetical protein J6590_011532 [Homalodisca vitripennis]|nr:hypothetical protein J6590_011532 [Homalodisca vitripennis]
MNVQEVVACTHATELKQRPPADAVFAREVFTAHRLAAECADAASRSKMADNELLTAMFVSVHLTKHYIRFYCFKPCLSSQQECRIVSGNRDWFYDIELRRRLFSAQFSTDFLCAREVIYLAPTFYQADNSSEIESSLSRAREKPPDPNVWSQRTLTMKASPTIQWQCDIQLGKQSSKTIKQTRQLCESLPLAIVFCALLETRTINRTEPAIALVPHVTLTRSSAEIAEIQLFNYEAMRHGIKQADRGLTTHAISFVEFCNCQ